MDPINETPQPKTAPVAAYCRACGKGLASDAMHTYQETVYCADHIPRVSQAPTGGATAPAGSSVPPPAHDSSVSPGLAFLLGLIPGVGAIYNGQYGKGFVHVLIAGLLFSLASSESGVMEPFFEMFVPVWFFYMAFEAYHTAKKRMQGEPVDEFSSLFPNRGGQAGTPILPILLIVLGVLFLLNNLEVLSIRKLIPYAGPVFLIALGSYMLYARVRTNAATTVSSEASHERS